MKKQVLRKTLGEWMESLPEGATVTNVYGELWDLGGFICSEEYLKIPLLGQKGYCWEMKDGTYWGPKFFRNPRYVYYYDDVE